MITTYILIIAVYRSGATSAEFVDKRSCEYAMEVAKRSVDSHNCLAICVPKQVQP